MVRRDIMHRQAAPVKANEQSISPKAIRGGGPKAQLREALRVSDAYLDLSLRARAVFDALLDHAGKPSADEIGREMMHCWPSRKTLATRLRRSEDFIDRGLAELRKAGLVISVNRGGWTGKRNVYTIFIPAGVIRERVDEAIAETQTAQSCGVATAKAAATNAADRRHPLEPCIQNHEKRTTTTETRHAQPAQPASTHAAPGGGGVSLNDEMQRAKAKLRELGVRMNDRAIENMLRAGNITEAIVEAAWRGVPDTANDEAAVLVSMLQSADVVEGLRAKAVEESKAIEVKNERAAFDRLSEDERRFWCDRARKHWPNLGQLSLADNDPTIQGAAFKVYRMSDKRNIVETITEAVERAKTSREDCRLNGKQAIADRITQAIENIEHVTNDPSFITAAVEVITIADAGERFKALARLARLWAGEVERVESTLETKGVV
jgi:hypothetical protein